MEKMIELMAGLPAKVDYEASSDAMLQEHYEGTSGIDAVAEFDGSFFTMRSGAVVQAEYVSLWDSETLEYIDNYAVNELNQPQTGGKQ